MCSIRPFVVFFFLCLVTVRSLAEESKSKTKRDASSSLYAFPRVGRGNTWDYSDIHEIKRQGLVPFPRIGRGGGGKRDTVQGGNGAMWFGPRLGRLQKREIDNGGTWAVIQLREFPFLSSRQVAKDTYTPRLGRESNEEYQNIPADYQQKGGHQPDPNNFTPRLGRENIPESF